MTGKDMIMPETDALADFVVLPDIGPAFYGRCAPGQSINDALRAFIPDLSTQGARQFRMWFSDTFGPDARPNPLADKVIGALCYRHCTGWYGTVALSMEEQYDELPPLTNEARVALDELISREGPR